MVGRNFALAREPLGGLDQPIVVGSDGRVDAVQQQLLHVGLILPIDIGLLREGDLRRFVVGTLDQPYPDSGRIEPGDVVGGAIKIALQHNAAVGKPFVQRQDQVERPLRVG